MILEIKKTRYKNQEIMNKTKISPIIRLHGAKLPFMKPRIQKGSSENETIIL